MDTNAYVHTYVHDNTYASKSRSALALNFTPRFASQAMQTDMYTERKRCKLKCIERKRCKLMYIESADAAN